GRYGLLNPLLTETMKARDFFRAFFLCRSHGRLSVVLHPPRRHLQLLHRPNVFKDAPKIRLRRKAHGLIGIQEAQPASPVSAYYDANSRKHRAGGGLSALARSLNAIVCHPRT